MIDSLLDVVVSSSVLYLGDTGLEHVDGCSLVVLLGVAGVSVTHRTASESLMVL